MPLGAGGYVGVAWGNGRHYFLSNEAAQLRIIKGKGCCELFWVVVASVWRIRWPPAPARFLGVRPGPGGWRGGSQTTSRHLKRKIYA